MIKLQSSRLNLDFKVIKNTNAFLKKNVYFLPAVKIHFKLPHYNHFIQLTYTHTINNQPLNAYFNQYYMEEPEILFRETRTPDYPLSTRHLRLFYSFVNPLKSLFLFSLFDLDIKQNDKLKRYQIFPDYSLVSFDDNGKSIKKTMLLFIDKKWFNKAVGIKLKAAVFASNKDYIFQDHLQAE